MSAFDAVVDGLLRKAPLSASVVQAMMLVRKMRDARVRAHVVGCSRLLKKAGAELVVYVDSPIWAQEFQMNAPAFLAEWNVLCDREHVDMSAKTVKFQVSSRVHLSGVGGDAKEDTYRKACLETLTREEMEEIDREVAVISDERLRKSAKSAMIGVYRWKKSNERPKAD